LLDELRDVAVSLAAAGTRLEVVGDVADEDVLERPLLVSLDPRPGLTANQVAPLEPGERRAETVGIARDPLDRATPEDAANDRCVEHDVPLLGRKRVEAGGDEAADRRGEAV